MKRTLASTALYSSLLLATGTLLPTVAPSAFAQESGGATTIASKQKVSILVDRETSPQGSILLVKILIPSDAKADAFMLADPTRLVIDFVGLKLKSNEVLTAPKNTIIKQIRLGAHPDKLRIVMDLSSATPPQFEWKASSRQATLKIIEATTAAPIQAPTIAPTTPPTPPPTTAPTTVPTVAPTVAPTSAPTEAPKGVATVASPTPSTTPTGTPTGTPTRTPTVTPSATPTMTSAPAIPTKAPTILPTPIQEAAIEEEPKVEARLPDLTDKDLEAALDKEIARAAAALAKGDKLPDEFETEEDLTGDSAGDDKLGSAEEEPAQEDAAALGDQNFDEAPRGALAVKDLPTNQAGTTTGSQSANPLRANVVPTVPATEFTIESAGFDYLEPGRNQAFKFTLSKPGAEAQISKVDATTYKIVIQKCGIANLGLALPQYPPSDFQGLVLVSSKVQGDTVEITAEVETGVTLMTFMRDKELWLKKK